MECLENETGDSEKKNHDNDETETFATNNGFSSQIQGFRGTLL